MIEVSDYLFNPNGKSTAAQHTSSGGLLNNGNWTNQTSRFQLGGASENNSSQKKLDTGMNGNTLSANAGGESSIDVQAEASRDDRNKEKNYKRASSSQERRVRPAPSGQNLRNQAVTEVDQDDETRQIQTPALDGASDREAESYINTEDYAGCNDEEGST